jgi:hypothetical protein
VDVDMHMVVDVNGRCGHDGLRNKNPNTSTFTKSGTGSPSPCRARYTHRRPVSSLASPANTLFPIAPLSRLGENEPRVAA